ncbi:MAG: hypothetical protein GY794_20510 [bacterium]|nr:hypothetical protein [bacterium]
MANPEKIERAFFQVDGSTEKIEVHFNPETLQYTITNNMRNQGSGNTTKQYVSDSTGKLTLDLIFDSTGSGEDIRLKTVKIAKFMEPTEGSGTKKTPPKVNFEWGLYKFTGLAQSYKETLDYFSANGIPLRSSINITLSSQEKVFEATKGGGSDQPNNAVPAGSLNTTGATGVATKAGNPGAWSAMAQNNNIENPRFIPAGISLELDASVSLQGPSGFSSAGVSLDLGIDIGASGEAFAGLHAGSGVGVSATLDLDSFIDTDVSGSLGLDSTSIGPGGGAGLQGSASLKAEVGQAGEFKSRIEFDGG